MFKDQMEFTYGPGAYIEGTKNLEGRILLGEHKLYLRGAEGDLAQTFIPLEKIEGLRRTSQGLEVHVRPSLAYRYTALIKGKGRELSDLTKELVQRRGLKKKFLKREWIEEVQ